MNWLEVSLRDGRTAYRPGEKVQGTALWQVEERAKKIELRLFWYTEGKGDRDLSVVAWETIDPPSETGQREFSFDIPSAGPTSFSGTLISLLWAIELVIEPGDRAARAELVVGPDGREILLPQPAP